MNSVFQVLTALNLLLPHPYIYWHIPKVFSIDLIKI